MKRAFLCALGFGPQPQPLRLATAVTAIAALDDSAAKAWRALLGR